MNPSPAWPSRFETGTRQPSRRISQCPIPPACPITDIDRTISYPGVSVGTSIWLARLCGGASGSLTTMTIATSAPMAPVQNHLWPSITHSSPSRTALVSSVVGSDPATSGSVIAKQLRIEPSSSGASQRSLCSSVPWSTRISIFPVSGAEQLKANGATGLRPIVSHSMPYSQFVSPAPSSSSGRKRFQRPSDFALSRIWTSDSGYGTPGPIS